jgi:hypothetical protein
MTSQDDAAARRYDLALANVASFQGAVQHADDKAKTVVTVLGMLTAFVATQLGLFVKIGSIGFTQLLALAILVAFFVAHVVAGIHLFHVLVPRLDDPGGENRFAFPSVARELILPATTSMRVCGDEAWRLAGLLARRAVVKHGHVRKALYWTSCAYISSVTSLVLFVLSR